MTEEDPRQRLAYDRTQLANERTFAAWIRTGIAVFAAGFGIAHFSPVLNIASDAALWLGALLALAGVGFVLFGAWRFARVSRHLHQAGSPGVAATLGAIFLLAALLAVLLLVVLLLLIF